MPVTNYAAEKLRREHRKNADALRKQYKRGHCVIYDWSLRVSNNGATLVTPYKVMDETTGEWSGVNEYTEAL